MSAVIETVNAERCLTTAAMTTAATTAHRVEVGKPNATMLQGVRELADGPLAELADEIDRAGVYPLNILQSLGSLGALKVVGRDGTITALASPLVILI